MIKLGTALAVPNSTVIKPMGEITMIKKDHKRNVGDIVTYKGPLGDDDNRTSRIVNYIGRTAYKLANGDETVDAEIIKSLND